MLRLWQNIAISMALFTVAACSPLANNHGYVPDDALLAQVIVGQDSKETAGRILGRPSTQGIVNDDGWYYIKSEFERFLWRAPVEVDREVVVVSFNDAGLVSNIERFGLENGQVVVLSRRVTETSTQGASVLAQIFSNIGRVDVGSILAGQN